MKDTRRRSAPPLPKTMMIEADGDAIGFKNCSFTWSYSEPSSHEPASPQMQAPSAFRLTIPGKLLFAPGQLNIITGPTGSGKSTLLYALLGEVNYEPFSNAEDSWVSFPRDGKGGVAYAARDGWLVNGSIKVWSDQSSFIQES